MILRSPERPHRAPEKPVVRYTDIRVCPTCDTITPVKGMYERDTRTAYITPNACPTCGTEFNDE